MDTFATLVFCASLSAVDGDTIRCDGQNMRIMGPGRPHVSGIDAPESRGARCQAERMLADLATRRLEQLLASEGTQVEDSGERDRWNRPLVWVRLADGRTAGEVLLEEGYAVPWEPRYRPAWCTN